MKRWNQKRVAVVFLVLALVLWVVAGSFWYSRVYMTKERRFWTAIANGLRTSSVTKEVVQTNPNGNSTQYSRMSMQGDPYAYSRTKVYNRNSTVTDTTIVSSTLQNKTNSFVKYDSIQTNNKKEDGSEMNFDNIVNIWASRDSEDLPDDSKLAQLAESYIQLVPFANLEKAAADEFVSKLQSTGAYTIDFNSVMEDKELGLTVYDVTVNAKPYVAVLSEVFKKAGFGEVAALDASQYDETSTIKVKMAIDGANTLRKIAFDDKNYESYMDYGVMANVPKPENPISIMELQTRLQTAR